MGDIAIRGSGCFLVNCLRPVAGIRELVELVYCSRGHCLLCAVTIMFTEEDTITLTKKEKIV